jgi:hypothetical protein
MIETIYVPPTPYPTGFLWWFRNGDSWHAPEINNGKPYLPETTNQFARDFFWFCRNPIGNFMGFVIGFEGSGYYVSGPAPVMATTPRDEKPERYGWKYSIINGWAPFVAYNSGKLESYLGWRPASGGFGFKLIFKD